MRDFILLILLLFCLFVFFFSPNLFPFCRGPKSYNSILKFWFFNWFLKQLVLSGLVIFKGVLLLPLFLKSQQFSYNVCSQFRLDI